MKSSEIRGVCLLLLFFVFTCRSLVATNDHLLQELEEAKQRHGLEIAQLNGNYQQLRKTVQLYS